MYKEFGISNEVIEASKRALENVKKSLEFDKNNLRLQLNLEEMEKYVNKKSDN